MAAAAASRARARARETPIAEADELERTDVAGPAVDLQRDVGRREIADGLAVLRQREKIDPDQIDGGAKGFGLSGPGRAPSPTVETRATRPGINKRPESPASMGK